MPVEKQVSTKVNKYSFSLIFWQATEHPMNRSVTLSKINVTQGDKFTAQLTLLYSLNKQPFCVTPSYSQLNATSCAVATQVFIVLW